MTISRPRARRAALAGVLALILLGLLTAVPVSAGRSTPSAQTDYPVPYGHPAFAEAIAAYLRADTGPPVGANDWSCRPSSEHPDPVVLVHGGLANMAVNWVTISPLLANEGYCVFALNYGVPEGSPPEQEHIGGRSRLEESAEELAAFVDEVLAATGADQVDIVGHSEGSLMANYYVKFLGGAARVDRYVALTPLWDGTSALGIDALYQLAKALGAGDIIDDLTFPAFTQLLSSSEFIAKMNEGGTPAMPGVTYTNVMTRYDIAVTPYTSGMMEAPNATNVVLQDVCPLDFSGHGMVAYSPNTAQVVLNALDPANARPVRCHLVLPSI